MSSSNKSRIHAFLIASAMALSVGVVHAEDMKGRIQSIDKSARSFTIASEVIYVTDKTDYENDYERFEDLREGHYVEVDIERRDGRLYADDIEFKKSKQ